MHEIPSVLESVTCEGIDLDQLRLSTTDISRARNWCLTVLVGEARGRTFSGDAAVVIGRGADADIVLDAPEVSKRHAAIEVRGGDAYLLRDLESKNGTFVNGERVTTRELRYGDRIQLGRATILLFGAHDKLADDLEQLRKLEATGRVAGSVAHDFKNLLTVILCGIDAVRRGIAANRGSSEDVREALDDSQEAARRATDLANQLLLFARRGEWQSQQFSLSDIVVEGVRLFERAVPKNIQLQVTIAPGLEMIGDPSQLHQVIMNLVVNARDAMPGGGRIMVTLAEVTDVERLPPSVLARQGSRFALLEISDEGSGMDQTTLKHLFEPFFTTKPAGQGTGLGLATVYGIVKRLLGDISVESELGRGSTFTVFLPIAKT